MNDSSIYKYAHPFVQLSLRLALHALAPRWKVSGRGHIPRRGPVILAPNHVSNADPPLVGAALWRPVWFMAKKELFEIPVLSWVLRFCQSFPVEQGGADRAALRRAEQLLAQGQAVVVFPEGQCTPGGELGPLLPGVSMLALRTKAPIIPVGISGSTSLMPYGEVIPRPTLAPVHVHFGPLLDLSHLAGLSSREQRETATQQLQCALQQALAVARGQAESTVRN